VKRSLYDGGEGADTTINYAELLLGLAVFVTVGYNEGPAVYVLWQIVEFETWYTV